VLDQTEEVGSRSREWTTDVVLTEPIELRNQRRTYPAELVVEIFLPELIDHQTRHYADSTRCDAGVAEQRQSRPRQPIRRARIHPKRAMTS